MKKDTTIRIEEIRIENIKNVKYGEVNLNKTTDETRGGSIVGIYGQNGSGKTALILAVDLIKTALTGSKIPDSAAYYILAGEQFGKIQVDFTMDLEGREYLLNYELAIKKIDKDHASIYKESLDYSSKATESLDRITKSSILNIEVNDDKISLDKSFYGPDLRLKELATYDKNIRNKLTVIQALAMSEGTSYIFNKSFIDMFKETYSDTIYYKIISRLYYYARFNLFVLNKNCDMSYNMNILPLTIRIDVDNMITKSDGIPLGLNVNSAPEETFDIIKRTIDQIDILMDKIVPGLNIEIVPLDRQLDKDGNSNVIFELASNRNGIPTPLRYESEGIKKILGILSSLIAMYNEESVFVAIDELDASIFEYLLGEILLVIKKTGKGQLLFTSHNMRPLEVLDNSNIYFTTTNPNNKYIQFTGIKNNNNLRTTLLRTIDLGGQKESVYENTNSYQIGKAFRKAGDFVHGK